MIRRPSFFFFNDTATTEIYTLSLHDALPISGLVRDRCGRQIAWHRACGTTLRLPKKQKRPGEEGHRHAFRLGRSEEHTSELQSRLHLVCRLLLEKKK